MKYVPIPYGGSLIWTSADIRPETSGWYPCSIRRNPTCLRWYDAEKNAWSEYCPPEKPASYAAHIATLPAKKAIHKLEWAKPWW